MRNTLDVIMINKQFDGVSFSSSVVCLNARDYNQERRAVFLDPSGLINSGGWLWISFSLRGVCYP